MRKWKSLAAASVLVLALIVPLVAMGTVVSATEQGLTPGYWKNHTDSWPAGIAPGDSLKDAIEVFGPTGLPDITIMAALTMKGGHENAFYRHLAAAWLNANHPDINAMYPEGVYNMVLLIYPPNNWDIEYVKDLLESANELPDPWD